LKSSRSQLVRRTFLKLAASAAVGSVVTPARAASVVTATRKSTDIRIERVTFSFEDFLYRSPVKFAGALMDRATVLTVECVVRTRAGKVATGAGAMPFNHIFSYPSKTMTHDAKNSAMKALAVELAKTTERLGEYSDPIDLGMSLAPEYLTAAVNVSAERKLPDPIPKLCTLVTAAAFDAAIHDAFGQVHGVSVFDTYGPEYMNHDLSRYLGPEYKGDYPGKYLLREPKPQMTLCHLVGAVDPLDSSQLTAPIRDGLPETLADWIPYNGLRELKVKVNGDGLAWDVERVLHVDRVMHQARKKLGNESWEYVIDFNEKCPHVDYYIRFLQALKARLPDGLSRVKYVEQPTARDLRAHPENAMHEAAKLCPVIIDESLIDVDSLLLARELGWTGAVVKSPKGLTNMLLITAVAVKKEIFLGGGDMSCPGRALIQTAAFQARVPTITAVEANARQYLPQANREWESKMPGVFSVRDGLLRTRELNRPGLSA
jgi:L-alanine-DL-glutamate epimerase-like enolase superfamily enzyme